MTRTITIGCGHGLLDAMQVWARKNRRPDALVNQAVFNLNAEGNTISFDADAIEPSEFMEYLRDYSAEKIAFVFAGNSMQTVWLHARNVGALTRSALEIAANGHTMRTEGRIFEPLSRINRFGARA
jgi:hypothetical protein